MIAKKIKKVKDNKSPGVDGIPPKLVKEILMLKQNFLRKSTSSGYLDVVQRLEFGVDHLQKNALYQIE